MEVGGCIQKSMVFVASAQCQMYFLMLERSLSFHVVADVFVASFRGY